MAETTNLEVVTPSAIIVSDPVEMVVVPGSDGQIGALPRHSKVISTLDRGLVDICLLYTSPSPRDVEESRMPSSA